MHILNIIYLPQIKHILPQKSKPNEISFNLTITMAGLVDKAKEFVAEKIANMEKPEAAVKNVDLKGVSTECITYKADVNVSNPYSTPIPICEISYTFKSAGSFMKLLRILYVIEGYKSNV
ncbi:hypothetical protein Hdeb2414_s0183g00826141 [Helianthus debilis subsp. tardiflorus]